MPHGICRIHKSYRVYLIKPVGLVALFNTLRYFRGCDPECPRISVECGAAVDLRGEFLYDNSGIDAQHSKRIIDNIVNQL